MQTLRIVITLSHLSALHDALRETFSQGDQYLTVECLRRALISNNSVTCMKERTVGRNKEIRKEGEEDVVRLLLCRHTLLHNSLTTKQGKNQHQQTAQ